METYWVVPGKFLAGEYPGSRLPYDPLLTRKLDYLLKQNVSYFLDLTEPGALIPYEEKLLEEAGWYGYTVEYHRFPIPDFGVPSREKMNEVLDMLDAALEAGQTVYVHCWAGIGRTGTVVGCYLVRHGLTGSQALLRLADLRGNLAGAWRRSPESAAQWEMIMHF
jgi:Dual specificity phosphatase, catalytic domain